MFQRQSSYCYSKLRVKFALSIKVEGTISEIYNCPCHVIVLLFLRYNWPENETWHFDQNIQHLGKKALSNEFCYPCQNFGELWNISRVQT